LTDGELIAAVRQGDADAWRMLYQRWLPWVWRYAYSLVKDKHAAEDITSEAMMVWVRQVGETVNEPSQLAGWLRQVIHNKSVDYHRQGQRFRRAVDGVSLNRQDRETAADPSHTLETSERQELVNQALGQMGESQRLVLEWKYAEGLSVRQIAERLGTTEKAVEANLYRARVELRSRWQLIDGTPARDGQSNDEGNGQLLAPRSRSES
jgi:RNA polymerase sigma-70 factor, ECF subfamily